MNSDKTYDTFATHFVYIGHLKLEIIFNHICSIYNTLLFLLSSYLVPVLQSYIGGTNSHNQLKVFAFLINSSPKN